MAIYRKFHNARREKNFQTNIGADAISIRERKQWKNGGFVVNRKETIPVARIKIEKQVEWIRHEVGEERKDLLFIATIATGRGRWTTTFNESNKKKFWKHLKEEIGEL
jgi:hypothetical protein